MMIRVADPDRDAALLQAIYAPYVYTTAVSFAYLPPTVEEFAGIMRDLLQKYPYLVAEEEDGTVLGYAYAAPFHKREAFGWDVEVSVYVEQTHRRSGAGRALYTALEACLTQMGVVNMYASIAYAPTEDEHLVNDSTKFHKKMGFEQCAHFPRCGYKFDRWYDFIWMGKVIGDAENVQPLRPFSAEMLDAAPALC